MAVYCEPISDEKILAQLGDSRSVLIIGCPSCPAIWYARDGDSPAYALTMTGIQSTSTKKEIDRLTELLTMKKVCVESWLPRIPNHLCEIDRDRLRAASKRYQPVDAIIVLGCNAGKENVVEGFKSARTISVMKAKGLISFPIVRKLNKYYADRANVRVYPFHFVVE